MYLVKLELHGSSQLCVLSGPAGPNPYVLGNLVDCIVPQYYEASRLGGGPRLVGPAHTRIVGLAFGFVDHTRVPYHRQCGACHLQSRGKNYSYWIERQSLERRLTQLRVCPWASSTESTIWVDIRARDTLVVSCPLCIQQSIHIITDISSVEFALWAIFPLIVGALSEPNIICACKVSDWFNSSLR